MKRGRGRVCPYLDTVDRSVLDFDYEKLCSVTLSNNNVYACLVCGKFFRGRGVGTPAHTHSLDADHHVFLCFANQRVFCLPDDYEVHDHALDDVKRVLDPRFTDDDVRVLDAGAPDTLFTRRKRCLTGAQDYLPGFVGLNNLSSTDSFNAVLQCLAHVPILRDFFMRSATVSLTEAELGNLAQGAATVLDPDTIAGALGLIIRKLWSPYNYRAHVSPHELLQIVQRRSKGTFTIGKPMEPLALLQFLLNELRRDLSNVKAPSGSGKRRTVVEEAFQGTVEVTTTHPTSEELPDPDNKGETITVVHDDVKVTRAPFFFLSLDLPQMPLFKEGDDKSFLPQVPIMTLLQKFDGKKEQLMPNGERKRYSLLKLPQFLILHIKRFTHNNWFLEKNSTIVNFPMRHLDLRGCLHPSAIADNPVTRYSLLTMIKHEGSAEDAAATTTNSSATRSSVVTAFAKASSGQWYEMQDLSIRETIPDLISVSEAYIQIYQLEK